jgi:hypothetical protein
MLTLLPIDPTGHSDMTVPRLQNRLRRYGRSVFGSVVTGRVNSKQLIFVTAPSRLRLGNALILLSRAR